MREIKFKWWDFAEKEMLSEYDLDNRIIESGEDGYFHFMKVARYHPLQSTGLKDKNGVEIYEGDILDYSGDKKSVLMFEVVFHYASFKRKWLSEQTIKTRGFEVETLAWNTSVIFEVIGNIYENPELLEGAK